MSGTSTTNRTLRHEITDGRWEVGIFTDGRGYAIRDGLDDGSIGLWFDGEKLTDYDGISGFLPRAVAVLLIKAGIKHVGNFTEHSL